MTKYVKLLSLLMCLVLMCCAFAACGNDKPESGLWKDAKYTENTTLGEGAKTVVVKVEADGYSIELTVKTDAATLGDALSSHGLLEGEESEYGLYIKKVNGILADYDVDGYYWGFYRNGEYMMSGVDTTEIKGGEHFELVRTK